MAIIVAALRLLLANQGELGADVFDLTVSSKLPVTLYASDGVTLLTDTDGDKRLDTGKVNQDDKVDIVAKMAMPATAVIGNPFTGKITATSSLNKGKSEVVNLQVAVPTSFAQLYSHEDNTAVALIQTTGQADYIPAASYNAGNSPAMLTAPDGSIIYTSYSSICRDADCNTYYSDVMLAVTNTSDSAKLSLTRITDNSGGTDSNDLEDLSPAAAPDGTLAVAYVDNRYNDEEDLNSNVRVVLARPSAGAPNVIGPVINLTQNTSYRSDYYSGVPEFYYVKCVATGDNRFVIVWDDWRYDTVNDGWLDNIFAAVIDSSGNLVQAATQLTSDTAGKYLYHSGTTVTALKSNQVLIGWGENEKIYRTVYTSGLTNVSKPWKLGNGYDPDSLQLPGGNIAVAWTESYRSGSSWNYRIDYALLSGTSFKPVKTGNLSNPAALGRNESVSIATDLQSHIILTWDDFADGYSLYYSLLTYKGSTVTSPTIFNQDMNGIWTNWNGYGNGSYTPAP